MSETSYEDTMRQLFKPELICGMCGEPGHFETTDDGRCRAVCDQIDSPGRICCATALCRTREEAAEQWVELTGEVEPEKGGRGK